MKIELTKEEALVLFDWLYKNNKKENSADDPAEQSVFWNMECQLEKALTEIFMENYNEILAEAKEKVIKECY